MVALLFGSAAKAADFYSSRICIERPGEMGHVNIAPVTIRISDMGELTILGEREVCVGAGFDKDYEETVSLKFPYPYWGPSEKIRWWTTKAISVPLKSGKTTHLLLCERRQNHSARGWDKTGWHDMWVLLPPSKRDLCRM